MVGKQLSLLIVLLLIVPITLANYDYNESGNINNLYQNGFGFFNDDEMQSSSDYSLTQESISTQKLIPLVSDLNNDSVNEIIILDGYTLELYQNKTLDLITTYQLPSDERYSNLIAYDIDGDSLTELIIAGEQSHMLHIMEYNGTTFTNESSLNITTIQPPFSTSGEIMIKCNDVNKCFMALVSESSSSKSSSLYGLFFNSTFIGLQERFATQPTTGKYYCFPKIRHIASADIDNDDYDEFIFSTILVNDGSGDEIAYIYFVEVLSNGSVVLDYTVTETAVGNLFEDTTANSCVSGIELEGTDTNVFPSNYISSPLVHNLKGSIGDGLETVIAFNVGTGDFNMALYNGCSTDGCTVSRQELHPDYLDTNGDIISNVILADVFDDSGNEDYCVMGYEPSTETLRLLCASEKDRFYLQDEIQFEFDTSEYFNTSSGYDEWNTIIHASQHSQDETIGTKDTHEIVASYGIFQLDFESPVSDCRGLSFCSLDLIFENPAGDSALISVDAEKSDREDLIALSQYNLWYIDDKYTNTQAQIAPLEGAYNPCLGSTWKINTSVEIKVRVIDEEEDTVQARVILYYNDPESQQDSGWSSLQSTSSNPDDGRIFTFSASNASVDFTANKTIGTGTIYIMVRDGLDEHQGNPTTVSRSFSVASNGVEFNDCTSDEGGTVIPEVTPCDDDSDCDDDEACVYNECVPREPTRTTDAGDNVVISGCSTITDLTGLSCTSLWLVGMLVMTVLIWYVMAEENHIGGNATMGTIVIANVLAILLGARLSILGTGMVVIMVLLGVIIAGVFLGKFFTGLHSSGQ